MKDIRILIYSLVVFGAFLMPTNSCKKDDDNINPNQNGTVTDIEGNVYKTVTIGTKVWMAENLKTTKFRDGTSIPNVTDDPTWSSITTPAYCWYNNDVSNKIEYGALYNWYSVNTENLAPTGWHIPTNYEWDILIEFLGGENVAGGKLKETGTVHWNNPNAATNESGFTALSCGNRVKVASTFSVFGVVGNYGQWWSANEANNNEAYYYATAHEHGETGNARHPKNDGFSVRCVKDY